VAGHHGGLCRFQDLYRVVNELAHKACIAKWNGFLEEIVSA
jgi:hypothetical protein